MDYCSFVSFISFLACSISKDKASEEIALLSVFFTQLGYSLATIATLK